MDEIWQQFHRLPRVIRDAAARPEALATIQQLEDEYPQLDLASLVMRVMVKQVAVDEIPAVLQKEANVTPEQAQSISISLRKNVWQTATSYLGLPAEISLPTPAPEPPAALPIVPQPMVVPMPTPAFPQPSIPTGPLSPVPSLSAEDDAEIAHHAARVRQLQTATGGEDFSAIAQTVLLQHSLAFGDEMMRKRAESILKSQMKGMRDEVGTIELLQKDPKVGGLGLDPDQAQLVTKSVSEMVVRMKTEGRVSQTPMPMPPEISDLPQAKEERPAAMPPLRREIPVAAPAAELPSMTEAPRPSRPIIRPADIPPPLSQPGGMNNPAPRVRPAPSRPARMYDRPSVSDITAPVSTLGPAEEMHALSLSQFRRLGQGANDITQKIVDKFLNLQRESFTLWAEAVKGWRTGEVYTLYLNMGRESLEQGITISQVIEHRAAKQQPYLSEHEFNSLADLNKRLQL